MSDPSSPIMMRTARFFVPMLLLVLAGCYKLARHSPPLQQYVLGGASAAVAEPALVDTIGLRIGIRRIDLVPYLAVPAIIVRRGAHEIVTSQFHRWGEDLGEGINQTVAARLTNAPPVTAVNVAPWAARSTHDFLLQLHVSRFEGVADSAAATGTVHVRAAWDIIRPFDGVMLVRGMTDYQDGRFTVGDYQSLVSELNTALDRVARDIRTCLGRFRADSLPPPHC
jgi:uncharacterized lipoprotein YmbA